MTFNRAANQSRRSAPAAEAAPVDTWKAQGFINLYLPRKDGSRAKLGAIPLRDSKENERTLREWLEANEGNVDKLLTALIVNYQSTAVNEGNGFALPV